MPQVQLRSSSICASSKCFVIMLTSVKMQATSIWKELTSLKRVVSEPSGSRGGFDAVMQDYYGAVRTGQGAIFLAIFRGKVWP